MTSLGATVRDYITYEPANCDWSQGDDMNTATMCVDITVPQFELDSVEIAGVPVTAYDLPDEFWEKLKLGSGSPSPCWLWQGNKDKDGYGRWLNKDWNTRAIHRISYLTFVGSIPAKHQVHHICINRNCCNPNHLITCTAWEHSKLQKQNKD
jgi:hypothetical protein